jgi:hypothetical protein
MMARPDGWPSTQIALFRSSPLNQNIKEKRNEADFQSDFWADIS